MRRVTVLTRNLLEIRKINLPRRTFAGGESSNTDRDDRVQEKLKSFLSEESPLKGKLEDSEWATTPYPEGTLRPEIETIPLELSSIVMFPGQGNQYVGMGKDLLEYSIVKEMFDAASQILGYNLLRLCLEGPKDKLDRTVYCQPATLVCSLAAVERLKERYPLAISNCMATCGFSLGEISALVFAGCITFEKAVRLTKIRAEAMQLCSESVPGGLLSVLYSADSDLKGAMNDAREACLARNIVDPVCTIANYLIPECRIVGGHEHALRYIEENKAKYKLRKTSRLPVSGAFHTVLMEDAVEPVRAALKKLDIQEPIVKVMSNVTGEAYRGAREIRKKLPRQIVKPVKWEQIVHSLYRYPTRIKKIPYAYECGPGKSLTLIMKRLNNMAGERCESIPA